MLQTEAAQHQIQTCEFITAATDNSSRVFLPWWEGCVCTAITGWVLIAFPPQPLLQDQTAPSLKGIRERRKREFQLKEFCFSWSFHENCCAEEQTHKTMDSKDVNKNSKISRMLLSTREVFPKNQIILCEFPCLCWPPTHYDYLRNPGLIISVICKPNQYVVRECESKNLCLKKLKEKRLHI